MKEEQTKCVALVEQECDRFLGLYSADSSFEVSERALSPILGAVRSYLEVGHAPECDCQVGLHLARKPMDTHSGCEMVVVLERNRLVTAVGGSPPGLPIFITMREPRVTTLRELLDVGITPYDIVLHLKSFSMAFTVANSATQQPARA